MLSYFRQDKNRISWEMPQAILFSGTPGLQLRWWRERRNQRLARGSLFAEKRVRACSLVEEEGQCANQLACRGLFVMRVEKGTTYGAVLILIPKESQF